MSSEKIIYINDRAVRLEGEKNILGLARKAHIEIPTFCYHSNLSVFGACRLCLVEIEGRGLVTSCSTEPEEGMRIFTHTAQILKLRKTITEMLLANHDQACPTCSKSDDCKLRELSSKLGIGEVRFRRTKSKKPLDTLSDSLIRDPNKCVLCGDCVRYCSEIQGIGAIDFAHRGEEVTVTPAYNKSLAEVDCVNCGQCAAVCPTGAILVKPQIEGVWKHIHNKDKKVVVQIAPAVRVALCEYFNLSAGELTTGKIVTALKMIGFDNVYDTSYAADLTVIEEANEFLTRKQKGEKLPIFTSCCPAWVKYVEHFLPELGSLLSTCRSPQQMFGSIAKKRLVDILKVKLENLTIVSIMPCTAKKYEANREEFSRKGVKDVDFVLTTQEIGRMIKEAGIDFESLEPDSMDLPMGFSTGAGVIFGNSGGVSEAVIRFAADKMNLPFPEKVVLENVRGEEGIKEAAIETGKDLLKIAVVQGLKNAHLLAERVLKKEVEYDIVEVMACPGGCIGGAGQPVSHSQTVKKNRNRSLYNADKTMQLHNSQDNPFIKELYSSMLIEPNSSIAHECLHTNYKNRKRISGEEISFSERGDADRCRIRVCVGTSCYLRGAQDILTKTLNEVEERGLHNHYDIAATFCTENCDRGPTVVIDDEIIHQAEFSDIRKRIKDFSDRLEK